VLTKTTLKALYLGGGGLLATWLAVTPNQGAPTSPNAAAQQPVATREPSAEDLNSQVERLRARTTAGVLRPSTRNPVRFTSSKSLESTGSRVGWSLVPAEVEPSVPVAPPPLTLSGVTEKKTPTGSRRTAVISNAAHIYLVGEGDSVAGVYTVIKIDPEAVLLRDASGSELRLVLQ
jgi:hypothetical protein